MASVPQLLDDLCEALLPAAKVHLGQRRGSRKRAKQSLKRVAYNALFTSLFQDETRRLQPDFSRLPVKNKILMLSFDLRVGGLGAEADRLEELVEGLEAAPGRPLAEMGSVLDLLVQLSGSGPPRAPRRGRDYFLPRGPVGRRVPYGGYDCGDLRAFEADVGALISGEESLCQDLIRRTLQVMEAAPGTGLPFSYGDPSGDRFERDTRFSLFGALVHSRTNDMDVRLDLPPVPDSADLAGLAIKVPPSVDPSEDEGFQSASNLTPDSQSEPSMTPDIDLWDAVLTYEASKRRCWEQVGCTPGHREEPYLTEAGRDAFDRSCRLRHGELQVVGGGLLQAPQPILVRECELVKDALNVLIGVVSTTFSLCQPAQAFTVKQGVHVSGASPESMSSLLSEVAECGTHYARLSHFSLQPVLDSSCSRGLVFQAFTSGLRRYLQYYRACVLSTPPTLSLLTIGFLFKKLGRQLRYLAELCGVGTGTALPGAGGGEPRAAAAFPTGVKLLSYLYQEALDNCSNEHYPVLLSLLKTSCEPYTRFIHDWVYSGVFRDIYGEFMIQVNQEYLGFRDKFYWTHGYVLISKEVEDCVPVFLKHVAHDVYVCGKTINLLKLCCPRHYLCCSDVPVPRISVIFSLEELKDIEKDCAIYVGRMERVARHSSISKEEKELRMEIAKQELIIHAREAASRVLSELSDRQMSVRMALDARKREQFQRLKEQFEKDQEAAGGGVVQRRRVARQEELDDDFSYARELRDREKRLKALEEQLERKARQALVDHYSQLSAEAARREQRALWKVQRRRLASARLRFLLDDQKQIQLLPHILLVEPQEMLKDVSEEKPLELLAALSGAHSQVRSWGRIQGAQLGAGRGSQLGAPGQHCPGSMVGASLACVHPAMGFGPGRSGDTEDLSPSCPPGSQEGMAAQSSPDLGEEAAQRWGQEQAYLAGLAGQYCLERYPDSFEAMSEPPVARLLHHGLPRAFTLPEESRVQSDTDETAVQLSELLPLPVLMKHSITAPLAAHVSLVNRAAADYFFGELRLGAHFEALRHFLLMEDGEFAQSLSDLLFEKLGAGQTPGELLSPLALNAVLSKALQYSLHGHTPHAANLSFALKFLPEAFAPNAPDVLSCLELRYKVDWPLNIVVTESCLSRYSGIFSFLLQLKLMMWTLKDICCHLKRTARVSQAAGSVQFRQLQLFKHEMQHFVKVTQGYIANQILHVTWREFQARLALVGDLEEIQRAHAEYLHKAVFRGLLTEKAAPVMNVIHSIFSLVLKFRSQLISQPWGPASGPRGAEHPNFALMQQSYSTFKYYSRFLFKVVSKLVNRGYQPHLEDFLLRINFNNYYQDT
ncbi:Gamma-tubulin complex component 6 [Camelus dromedarius]|uniref:Gamma-tubulin complex component 6 n=1 Tax=Camelus dromedarius TaxID=9838 RepID=A0A5N4DGZ2_CAMDR|nr:Gamma-tubulin complex component 6 [Camelus dromedarius]